MARDAAGHTVAQDELDTAGHPDAAAEQVSSLQPSFITDANDELPPSVTVYHRSRSGDDWVPVTNQHATFAGASNTPSTISFDPVSTAGLKLEMTSPAP